jgi:transcriptional regulator with XRE-family HTH domain
MQTFAVYLEFSCRTEEEARSFLIELFRRSKNLSRPQLEKLANLPDRSLDRIEQGTRGVDSLELQRIALAVDRPLDDLFPKQIKKNGQNNTGDGFSRSDRKSQ